MSNAPRHLRGSIAAFVSRGSHTRAPGWSRVDRAQGLLELAEQLQGLLVPVEPASRFRQRLHTDLAHKGDALARSGDWRKGSGAIRGNRANQRRVAIWIVAAALGSLASVAGVVLAFVLRSRHSRATHAA